MTFGVFLTEFFTVFTGLEREFIFFGFLKRNFVEKLLAAAIVGFFAYINYKGAKETGKVGTAVTSAKIVILGIFVIFGALATFKNPSWPSKFLQSPGFIPNGFIGLLAAMGLTYVAFEGYDIIVQSGEEVKSPGTTIPKAIFYSLTVVIPLYILVAFAAIGGIEPVGEILQIAGVTEPIPTWTLLGKLGELGIIRAAGQFVPYGIPLLLIAALTATMSALNATIYASSRISFSMGRDLLLPETLSKIHPKTRSPHISIAGSSLLIALMATTLPIESVAASSSIMFILLFSMVNIAAIAMRRNKPELERPFKTPFMPSLPLLAIIFQLILTPFLLYTLGLNIGEKGFTALVTMLAWLLLGIIVYKTYSEEKELKRMEKEFPAIAREGTPAEQKKQILVALADPKNVKELMNTATDLAKKQEAEILILSMIKLPQQTPLKAGKKLVEPKRKLLKKAIQLTPPEIPVHGEIKIGHDIAQAILNTVQQNNTETVIMGWRSRPRRKDYILGSNVDKVVSKSPSNLLVQKIGEPKRATKSIIVPTDGGPHSELAAELAGAIFTSRNASVKVINVVSLNPSKEEIKKAEKKVKKIVEYVGNSAETKIVKSDDVASKLIEITNKNDLAILGAAREPLLQQLVFGALPEKVAKNSKPTVIMAKKKLPIKSMLKKYFKKIF